MRRAEIIEFGTKIGMLTLLNYKIDNNIAYYYCRCECGNYKWIRRDVILKSKNANCGCIKLAKNSKAGTKAYAVIKDKYIKENTNLHKISPGSKMYKNNKSGVKGVSWNKRFNKWNAQICLKGKVKNLGYFLNLEDAIKARKDAEEKYFKPILDKYKKG